MPRRFIRLAKNLWLSHVRPGHVRNAGLNDEEVPWHVVKSQEDILSGVLAVEYPGVTGESCASRSGRADTDDRAEYDACVDRSPGF